MLMKTSKILLTLVAPLVAGVLVSCAMNEEERLQSQMDDLRDQVQMLAQDKSCSATDDCRATELGERACGGPSRYVIYSVKTVDEPKLLEKIRRYNRLSRAHNDLTGAVSTCIFQMPPELECHSGECRKVPVE